MRYSWLLLPTLLLACGDDGSGASPDAMLAEQNCATDDRAPTFEIGLQVSGTAGYTLTLEAATPMPAARGDNAWTVSVTDGGGSPATGLVFAVDPQMPDHGHGTPITAVATETATQGTYTVDPINLWMPGYWTIEMALSNTGGSPVDTATFQVCVDP